MQNHMTTHSNICHWPHVHVSLDADFSGNPVQHLLSAVYAIPCRLIWQPTPTSFVDSLCCTMQTYLTTHSNIRRRQDVLCDADASDEGADAADDDDAVEIRR